jgi:hypothetical protein
MFLNKRDKKEAAKIEIYAASLIFLKKLFLLIPSSDLLKLDL